MRRRPVRKGERCQLSQRPHVDRTLEIDDLTHRLPKIDPSVLIELGLGCAPKVELDLVPPRPQQEPPLLLPNAHGVAISADILGRQTVPQPTPRLTDQIDVRWRQSNLLMKLSVNSLLEALPCEYTTLRKLPAPASDLPPEKYVSRAAHQDDADVSSKAV